MSAFSRLSTLTRSRSRASSCPSRVRGHHRIVHEAFTAAVATTLRDEAPSGVSTLAGGCDPFTVHAQNRWRPYGAAVRAAPYAAAKKVGGYESNELISVDGWVRTRAPYPTNNPPWNSDVWFHLSDDTGWVSFAGVRADPTSQDSTGMDPDGGRPAPTPAECSGSVNR